MVKGVTVACAVLCLCACASTGSGSVKSASQDLNYWLTPPGRNELVVMGVSARQTKQEAEIASAREDAARKISMYYGVRASVENTQNMGGFLDYFANSDITVEYNQQTKQYLENLAFDPDRDVFTRKNAVFIRFTYPAAFPGTVNYASQKNPNGSPRWTTSQPHEIGGFIAGVGFARRQQRIRDTMTRSCESAVAALVSRVSSSLTADEIFTFSHVGGSYVHQESTGNLSYFLILETWIDPKTEDVWTLAIARNAN